MDASAYNMSFDKEQLSVLCANYDRRIDALARENNKLKAENAKLREQMERLVALLRVDCDIDASWDGLRRFWSIELTDGGCLMRDRACKAEAENDKLRKWFASAMRGRELGVEAE